MSSNSPRLLAHVLLLIAMAACAATEEATRPDRTEPDSIGVGAGRGTGARTAAVDSAAHAALSGAEGPLEAHLDATLDLDADADLDEEMEWLRAARR